MKSPQSPTSLLWYVKSAQELIFHILTPILDPIDSNSSFLYVSSCFAFFPGRVFWSSSPAHDLSDCYSEILSCTPILCCLSHAPRITHLRTVKCVQLNTLTQCIMCAINKILCWTSYFKHSHNRGTKKNSRIILFYISHWILKTFKSPNHR